MLGRTIWYRSTAVTVHDSTILKNTCIVLFGVGMVIFKLRKK
jgi:hypothetical protein